MGSSVWLKAPYGEFIIPNFIQGNQEIILIAGGTGISPFIPFIKQAESSIRIQLNYGLKNKDHMIFDGVLEEVINNDNFFLNLYLEEIKDQINLSGNINIKEGILSVESILTGIINIENSIFFISGPPKMIESFQKQLIQSGIDKKKIVIDEWG